MKGPIPKREEMQKLNKGQIFTIVQNPNRSKNAIQYGLSMSKALLFLFISTKKRAQGKSLHTIFLLPLAQNISRQKELA